jgi:hypothetical protein
MKTTQSSAATAKKPLHPYLILALAIVLPGMGHVAAGRPARGLGFACFTLLLALFTYMIAPPDRSIIGKSALGLFVWALSIPDAYRTARLQWELWHREQGAHG